MKVGMLFALLRGNIKEQRTMINLIQNSPQQLVNENPLNQESVDPHGNINNQQTPFPHIMNKVMKEETTTPEEAIDPKESLVDDLLLEPDAKELLTNEAIQLFDENGELITDKTEEEPVLTAQESASLAWFTATSFEPPIAPQVTLSASDADKTIKLSEETKGDVQKNPVSLAQVSSLIAQEPSAEDTPVLDDTLLNNTAATDSEAIPSEKSTVDALKLVNKETTSDKPVVSEMFNFTDKEDKKVMVNSDKAAPQQNVVTQVNVPVNHQVAAPASPARPHSLELPQNVFAPDWNSNFHQQVMWMGQQKIDSAVIKLHPEELGPLEVKIKISDDNVAQLNITAHTHQVRDIIEQALPRLRDMMNDQGLTLSHVNIESNANQRDTQQNQQQTNAGQGFNQNNSDEQMVKETTTLPKKGSGMIDYFA